jgi:hypothetical protein
VTAAEAYTLYVAHVRCYCIGHPRCDDDEGVLCERGREIRRQWVEATDAHCLGGGQDANRACKRRLIAAAMKAQARRWHEHGGVMCPTRSIS